MPRYSILGAPEEEQNYTLMNEPIDYGAPLEEDQAQMAALEKLQAPPETAPGSIYPEGLRPEDRTKLLESMQPTTGERVGTFFTGLGGGINRAYGGSSQPLNRMLGRREARRKEVLGDFDQRRKDAIETYLAQQKLAASGRPQQDKLSKQKADRIENIRKEVQGSSAYTNIQTAERGLGIVKQFAEDPNGFTDYGTLMLALKSLQGDQSVIRQVELNEGKAATSLINKALNWVDQAIVGTSLQPEQRGQIVEAIAILGRGANASYMKFTAPHRAQVAAMGLPADQIFQTFEIPGLPPSPGKKTKKKEGSTEMPMIGGHPDFDNATLPQLRKWNKDNAKRQ